MNKQIVLFIDTSDNTKTIVTLTIDGKESRVEERLQRASQNLLLLIESILQKNKLGFSDITSINVSPGPGSYTGLKVGVAIANTLAFLLKIPINGKKIGEIIQPVYEKKIFYRNNST